MQKHEASTAFVLVYYSRRLQQGAISVQNVHLPFLGRVQNMTVTREWPHMTLHNLRCLSTFHLSMHRAPRP